MTAFKRTDPSRSFWIASEEEIRQGRTTDIYFVRTQTILNAKGLSDQVGIAEITVDVLPKGWPWAVFCGLDEVAKLLEGLPVDLEALPEGTLFPARDISGVRVPVAILEGPYAKFCLYETAILGMICQATGVATQAARVRQLAEDALVLQFGSRRMHPAISPMLDRASYLGGCDGVSTVLGAQRLGQAPRGTMPHALIIALGSSEAAWTAFDELMPASVPRVALVDTYSDEKEEAVKAASLLGKRLSAVRLDTPSSRRGNFVDLIREVRWELDVRGYRHVQIFVSGGIHEEEIPRLRAAGAHGFGIGTLITNAPTVDFSMDLVEMGSRLCAKRSRLSGRKSVWGCLACGAYLVLPKRLGSGQRSIHCPTCRKTMEKMLKPVLTGGRRVGRLPSPDRIRWYVLDQLRRRHG